MAKYRGFGSIEWSVIVKQRDGNSCQVCGRNKSELPPKELHAHHIMPWEKYPELRFDVDNGVTLCKQCHNLVHRSDGIFIERIDGKIIVTEKICSCNKEEWHDQRFGIPDGWYDLAELANSGKITREEFYLRESELDWTCGGTMSDKREYVL